MTYQSPDPARPDTGEQPTATSPRRSLGCALEIVETLVLTLVIYLLIHNFVAQPFEVEQTSMEPTILSRQYVLIDKISPHFTNYQRGDIVVFNPPAGVSQGGVPFIKRVIGLPGDTVSLENGHVYVTPAGGSRVELVEPYVFKDSNGKTQSTDPRPPDLQTTWVVPANSYFVMGDHRLVSEDSRVFGPISRDLIIGRALLRYFPIDQIGIFTRPTYPGLPEVNGVPSSPASSREWLPRAPVLAYAGSSATIQASMARP